MLAKLKKTFIAGIFAMLPLWVTAALLQWFFGEVDMLFSPILDGFLQWIFPGIGHIPGSGILSGLIVLLLLGFLARNVIGQRIFDGVDRLIQRIPVFRSLYSTVKQLIDAFSPESTASFKEVLLVEHPKEGNYAIAPHELGRGGERRLAVVFIPTNHLYLGDVFSFRGKSGAVEHVRRAGDPPAVVGGHRVPQVVPADSPARGLTRAAALLKPSRPAPAGGA
jgi:uncharacterized membrane protein